MTVDVLIEHEPWQTADLDALAQSAIAATLTHLGLSPEAHEIALLACDDARIADLNAAFRGKPTPTNVLSWPSQDRPDPLAPPVLPELGDIAIAYETCAREAAAQAKPFADHVRHLLVHGTLHLMGFDHETDTDAALMERTEVEILAKLGVPDPYRGMGE